MELQRKKKTWLVYTESIHKKINEAEVYDNTPLLGAINSSEPLDEGLKKIKIPRENYPSAAEMAAIRQILYQRP